MARPLATDALSLTGAGAALITDPAGAIRPGEAEGLVVDDLRVISRWHLDAQGARLRRVGWERTGPSSDFVLFTVSVGDIIDPIGTVERRRVVHGHGLDEELCVVAYGHACRFRLSLRAERDDQAVFHLGDPPESGVVPTTMHWAGDRVVLGQPGGGEVDVDVEAPGWEFDGEVLVVTVDLEPGESWTGSVSVRVDTERPMQPLGEEGRVTLASEPRHLGGAVDRARRELRALSMPIGGRQVIAAGSPYFLALFGRDSMITSMQFLVDSVRPLLDVLAELAAHQATSIDGPTRAEPGRILHELRIGRAGVMGVPPGRPYYGAVDTAPLFVVALGEAMRWGAPMAEVAALLPAARRALEWCTFYGDADGDGFIESVPHPSGLTNQGWKDSGDSMLDAEGCTRQETVSLAEVQAYWYRALRTVEEIEQRLGVGDGAHHRAAADALAARFIEHFTYDTPDGPFLGLALDADKKLLDVRTSNPGHVLWSGMLPDALATSVATQLGGTDLFSGWGVRTVGALAAGYNPFGYHRGAVWPHDTAFALHGAARHGEIDVVRRLSSGLLDLEAADGGELPELLSGIARTDVSLPVPYMAACRPHAWAAGSALVVLRALLGLEPDAPGGVVHLHPCLPEGTTVTIRDLQVGPHRLSFVVRGREVLDADAGGLEIVAGPSAVLSRTSWGPTVRRP